MKLLKFLVGNYPGAFALALAASVLAGAFNAGLLALLNAVLSGRGGASSAMLAGFAGLCLLLPLSRFATECLLTRIAQKALFDLRLRLSRRILSTPLRRLEEFGVQRLMTSLTEDVPVVSGTLAVLSNLCLNIAIVVGGLVYLGWLSPAVLLVTLGFLAVGILLYQLPVIKAAAFFRRARREADRLFGHFRALTTGTKELKLHRRRREMFISRVMEPSAAALKRDNTVGSVIYTAAASWGQSMIYVIVGSVVFLLPALYDSDQRVLTGYTLTLLYLMTPLQVIMNTLPNLTRASIALERVEKLGLRLAAGGTEQDAPSPPEGGPAVESVEMAGVIHSYRREGESSSFVLGPADMSLRPGELVFLVGGNGGGKTTLAKLLTGLYVPEGGEVRLNGRPVTDENREQYRELFSMVFSDFYLFESLIGLERPSLDEQARRYLVRLQLDHKVKVSEGTLSTTELSQGQRKRLALLVAYLEDRPVYVFDEWAADQDPQFKEFFYLQLLPELRARGKAVLVISHDDRYYHVADRLLKLEDGRLEDLSAAPRFAPQAVGGPQR